MPDNTGRRWIAIQDLAGKVAGSKMYKELKKSIESNQCVVCFHSNSEHDFKRGCSLVQDFTYGIALIGAHGWTRKIGTLDVCKRWTDF